MVNVLVVKVGKTLCGLPLGEVREVMRPLTLERNQSLPECVLGTCVIRQTPTPVIDLSAVTGRPAGIPERFVTVSVGERQVALAVEAVLGAIQIDARKFQEASPLVCGGAAAIQALTVLDSQLVYLMNSARLLPNEVLESAILGHATEVDSSARGGPNDDS